MTIPKRYFHDRLILLLLSVNGFLMVAISLFLLLRLDTEKGAYIVQYRANLGLSGYSTGSVGELISFVGFIVAIFIVHMLLSIKVYHPRRFLAVAILSLEIILMVMSLVVTNSLLAIR